MLQAELKYLFSADAPGGLEIYAPENPDDFFLSVHAIIGPKDSPGEESFIFDVCSPAFLGKKVSESGFELGRHYIIMHRYDYSLLVKIIKDLCTQAQGSDWETVGNYLARYGHWEFEDYTAEPLLKIND